MIGEVVCEVVIGDATTGINTPIQISADVRRPNVFVPIRTHTQNFEESASIGTSHTAEQYSYEFKVSDQKAEDSAAAVVFPGRTGPERQWPLSQKNQFRDWDWIAGYPVKEVSGKGWVG